MINDTQSNYNTFDLYYSMTIVVSIKYRTLENDLDLLKASSIILSIIVIKMNQEDYLFYYNIKNKLATIHQMDQIA